MPPKAIISRPTLHPTTTTSINAGETLKTFTGGTVWLDPVVSSSDNGPDKTLSVGNVNFAPCARTYWHRHEGGQLLRVLAGSGWVCDRGGEARRIYVGDVVWCPAGTVHWHGADDGRYMVHQAVSIGGVEWLEEVGDEEYSRKNKREEK